MMFRRLIFPLILFSFSAALRAEPLLEYQVKAVCVLNAARFVKWPAPAFASADSPVVIGVLGENPFGSLLQDVVKGETVQKRRIVVRRVSLEEAASVHVLFISASERPRLEGVLRALDDASVLTVSEMENFTGSGGMVGLTLVRGKMRLETNPEAARRVSLKFDSQFLLMTRGLK
jgi:hypothetical protein